MHVHCPALRLRSEGIWVTRTANRSAPAHSCFHIFVVTLLMLLQFLFFFFIRLFVFVITDKEFKWSNRLAHLSGWKERRRPNCGWIPAYRFVLLVLFSDYKYWPVYLLITIERNWDTEWHQFRLLIKTNVKSPFKILNCLISPPPHQNTWSCLHNQPKNMVMTKSVCWKPRRTKSKAVKCNRRLGQLISSLINICFQHLSVNINHTQKDLFPQPET